MVKMPRTIPVSHAHIVRVIRDEITQGGDTEPKRLVALTLSVCGYFLIYGLNMLIARLWLLRHRAALSGLAHLIPMQSYSFGIILEGMDAGRRLWQARTGVIAPRPILSVRRRNDVNPWLAELEGGFAIFLYPSVQGFNIYRPLRIVHWPVEAHKKFQSWFLPVLARALPETDVEAFWFAADRLLPAKKLSAGNEHYGFHVGYAMLRMQRPVWPVRLSQAARRRAATAIEAASSSSFGGTLNFYLRQKSTVDVMSNLRNGGGFTDYVPAIELALRRGWRIFINGDVRIPTDLRDRWKGRVLDAASCGLDKGLFSLFAATECTASVGEPGGGFWLPTMCGIPSLMINSFPYYMGREHTVLLFKPVTDPSGRRIPFQTMLSEHLYDHRCDGLHVSTNSPEEISDAVAEFLDAAEAKQAAGQAADAGILPWDAFARICGSRYATANTNFAERIAAQ
ncbi:TIGR04372 family glycosyltransferase [Undibacter mobilis]|uniref:TIGR04372 family glycosyltransferase n=1 Tax=Undibacter mobilis TaxID=2292256 RepID=A0A371B6E3_9BRAD|nr:TIGR04372 family glycosyltransferase [Undibacter mobilis]RDV03148.1 TIGR04372 family glycosyltransferase [Undibacter mobilis]